MASNHNSVSERLSKETAEEREERDHLAAFGHLDDFDTDQINNIKNNDPTFIYFYMDEMDTELFTDLAWELLGRYIANNVRLEVMVLGGLENDLPVITDRTISLMFKHLKGSKSLKRVNLWGNNFGFNGIHKMVPFLGNIPHLIELSISDNDNFDSACLEVVLEALDGSSIQEMKLRACNITDATAFEHVILPELRVLDLSHNGITRIPVLGDYSNLTHLELGSNNIQTIPFASLENCTNLEYLNLDRNGIGKDACQSIAELLRCGSLSLEKLHIDNNKIGDEGAKIIARSLRHNTTLTHLSLEENDITIESSKEFSALLNDVTTIDATYKSNHTLRSIEPLQNWSFDHCVGKAIEINQKYKGDAHGAGRAKVIATHLNQKTKRELCCLQNVNYFYSSVLAGIDPILLPNLLAVTSRVKGQGKLYRMLVATAHDVASTMDKKSLLKELLAKKSSDIDLLAAEIADLNKRLNEIEPDGTSHPRGSAIGTKNLTCGKKRARNASL